MPASTTVKAAARTTRRAPRISNQLFVILYPSRTKSANATNVVPLYIIWNQHPITGLNSGSSTPTSLLAATPRLLTHGRQWAFPQHDGSLPFLDSPRVIHSLANSAILLGVRFFCGNYANPIRQDHESMGKKLPHLQERQEDQAAGGLGGESHLPPTLRSRVAKGHGTSREALRRRRKCQATDANRRPLAGRGERATRLSGERT